MLQLLIFLFLCSPLIALVSIIVAISNGSNVKRLEEENGNLRGLLNLYKKKYGELDENEAIEMQKEIESEEKEVVNDIIANDENTQSISAKYIEEQELITSETMDETEDKSTFTSSIKEYIDKNNISQGNLLFALGVIFISVAGLVFATTTWKIIPNVLKVVIILVAALLVRVLSYFAKNKFKLIKTSITLYILFCILASLIPLSMGFYHMFGNYLSIGGEGQYLLYALSLLVFIVSFAMFIWDYKLEEIAAYLLYLINMELLLLILNFTKRFDLIMYILSIYNLSLLFVSNAFGTDGTNNIFIKKLREVSNNSLILLSIISLTNASQGILMSILSIGYAIFYLNDNIVIDVKKSDNSSDYKYIIAAIFLIASCIRFNIGYNFKWTSEYIAALMILLSIAHISFKKFKNDGTVYMIYIIITASIISLYKDFIQFGVTIRLLSSTTANLVAAMVLCIKTKEKTYKYLKTIFYLTLVISIARYMAVTHNFKLLSSMILLNVLLWCGYLASNILNTKMFKNKFADIFTIITYNILIILNVVIVACVLKESDGIVNRIIIYSILTVLAILIKYLNKIFNKDDMYLKQIGFYSNTVLYIINCYIIKINPIAAIIVFASMLYDYIKDKERDHISEYILLIAYLSYVNLLAYFVLIDLRIIVLLVSILTYFIVLNIITCKKIIKIDLKFIDITTLLNIVIIYIIESIYYANPLNAILISILFNLLIIYLYGKREIYYKNVIEVIFQFSMLISASLIYAYITRGSKYYPDWILYHLMDSAFYFWYYVSLMILSIVRILIGCRLSTYGHIEDRNNIFDLTKIQNNIIGLTKYCTPVALVICILRMSYAKMFFYPHKYIKFGTNLYILTAFLTLYLVAILVRVKITNKEYKSRNVLLLIIGQIITFEFLFIYLINKKLLPMYEKYIFTSSIKAFGTTFNIVFYLILINFAIIILYRYSISKYISVNEANSHFLNKYGKASQGENNNAISNLIDENYEVIRTHYWSFNSIVSSIVKKYRPLLNIIVNVGSASLILILIYIAYRFDTIALVGKFNFAYDSTYFYIMIIRYILLTIIINTAVMNKNIKALIKIFIYIIPYMIVNILWHASIINTSVATIDYMKIRFMSLLIVFVVYYALTFIIKNKKCRIEISDFNVSYYTIANLSIILYFNDSIGALSGNYLSKYIVMIDLIFAGIFVLQFKTENRKVNKYIYSISLLLITVALLIQNVVNISGYRLEYYLFIVALSLFVLDKCIWKFEKVISSDIWIIYHILSFALLFIKALTSNLIVNTIIFGMIMFITLLVSFIIKKYYHFVITVVYMILTALYVTRDFWLSIAWWAYLLVVGILLIVFATKNEQLKKDNKSFIILLKELNEKLKIKFQ